MDSLIIERQFSPPRMSRSELTIALREWSAIPVVPYDLFADDIFPDRFFLSSNHEEMTLTLPADIMPDKVPPPRDYIIGISEMLSGIQKAKRATLIRMFHATNKKLRIAKAAGNFKETSYLKGRLEVIENDLRRMSALADK